ncbi:uncharacterized protein LOC141855014 [Brevipalpus obovatus]|uniref:uncharacterized protein LOC141855014 n=1 Tax=Brevipalpus obovatus TaxID=246614 RepID=UPI003D9DF1E0
MCSLHTNMWILFSIIFISIPYLVTSSTISSSSSSHLNSPLASSSSSSNKINCDNSIDAAVWASDKGADSVYIFSDKYYYLWNLSTRQLSTPMLANESWPGLPPKLDDGCSFYDPSSERLVFIFLKDSKFYLYRDRELHASDSTKSLFTLHFPDDISCFTCDLLSGSDEVGIKIFSKKSNSVYACKTRFRKNKLDQEDCGVKRIPEEKSLQKAVSTSGNCQAFATRYDMSTGILDFVYFGSESVAIAKHTEVKIESLNLVTDCKAFGFLPNLFTANQDSMIAWTVIFVLIILFSCICCVWCVRRKSRKPYEVDSEGNFDEKAATAPAIAVTEDKNAT